jgi:threonine/homoserine/homoserine lactone efflux protein|tara:strand:+ start:5 stop:229 length:225 start_codon:yes stop_codon:yes gene_type:complete
MISEGFSMITENAHIFVMVVCLLVVIVLMIGLGGFAFGGEFNKKYANKLMRLRILLQAMAILLIIFFVYFSRGD